MFSVIIPTMWRAPGVFLQALNNYIDSDLVSEIIIINNDKDKTPSWSELNHSKVIHIFENQNTYVNPAWNKGVELASNDKICIANDDIVFDKRLFAKIYDRVIPENGVQGIITGEAIFNQPPTTDGSIDFIAWKPWDCIHCFGQLMFVHKSNWKPIIDGLDIYFGDDFIFHNHLHKGLTNYMIYNIHFFSPMAATSKDTTITGGFHDKEQPIWIEYFRNHPVPGL
jgi:glycosyltransferase involved in cell wall biosynthesis